MLPDEVKVEQYANLNRNRFAIESRGFEPPLLDALHGLFIQPVAKRLGNFDLAGPYRRFLPSD